MRKQLNQSGDTIVEVMIAVAVVGFVLAGAFVSANRSTKAVLKSQERAEALKFSESQLESIRAAAIRKDPVIFGAVGDFCIDSSGVSQTGGTVPCRFGTDGRYAITARREAGDTFRITTNWDSIDGKNVENIRLSYRLHQ